jgi:ring-1,2-phenylacetyl-CoA epoxidase subunit PaaD
VVSVFRGPQHLRSVLAEVVDPELPFLTIEDLGILRGAEEDDDGRVTVVVTPTYSGCPATEVIRDEILAALARAGHEDACVRTVLSPPWTTDDITERGRRRLEDHGIAPPPRPRQNRREAVERETVLCPRCRGSATLASEFGSTACKALMVCRACGEPFDHFKELV